MVRVSKACKQPQQTRWTNKNIECPWCVRAHAVYDVIDCCLIGRAKWPQQRIAKWIESVNVQQLQGGNV